jgi:hypothetical protein
MPVQYLKLGEDRYLPHFLDYLLIFRRYTGIFISTKSIFKEALNKKKTIYNLIPFQNSSSTETVHSLTSQIRKTLQHVTGCYNSERRQIFNCSHHIDK